MASKALKLFTAIVFILGIAVAANAGNCRQFFVQQYAAPIYAQPVILYQAGVQVEHDALAERIAQRVEAKIIQRLQATSAPQQQRQSATALEVHCAKCHSGGAPKGGLVIDGSSAIECRTITAALRAISQDLMPKDHKLTPEQKGAVMQQLLDLEREELPPVAPPPDGKLE